MSGGAPIRVMAESFRPISLNECPQWYRESSDAISNGNNHVKITVINTTVYMTTTLFANYSNFFEWLRQVLQLLYHLVKITLFDFRCRLIMVEFAIPDGTPP